jgi:sec-independent protein translocase protein TatA
MPKIGPLELVIVLVIVLLIFGVGRLGKLGKELGTGIREFRSSLRSEDGSEKESNGEDSSEA